MEILSAPLSVEEYLRTSFEDGDHEYIDGHIEERNLGTRDHAQLQRRLVDLLSARGLYAIQEVRLRVSATRYRVPDVQAYVESPEEQVFTRPPLLIAEVLSPEDRVGRLYERFNDYAQFGVFYLYLLDPERRTVRRFVQGDFTPSGLIWWREEIDAREIWGA
jgi:Uma2 family endonuclease